MKIVFFLTLAFFFCEEVFSQTFSHKEIYDSDFVFTEGIYLTKKDFSENKPIEKSRINSQLDPESLTFFEELMQQRTISLYDNLGQEVTIKTSEIFGYSSANGIYVLNNGTFSRVGIIGNICHFLGSKTVYNPAYSPYWDYYNRPFTQVSTIEPQQYFLVFETGQILEYTPQNLEMILMKDPALHDEYAELSRRKKNSKLFYYMRLYNEKHPLYIPVYQ
jgi:hypothetical protein